jgi:hypothetical protein
LERVGSENSKTTEKLLAAARELETTVCNLYRGAGLSEGLTEIVNHEIVPVVNEEPVASNPMVARWMKASTWVRYRIKLHPRGIPSVTLEGDHGRVSETRQAALEFSKHVADGLLGWIAEDLEKRMAGSKDGIGPLETASQKIKKQ